MVFSSLLFIFRFLPVALILYFTVPFKYKNLVLLVMSLIFYSWGEVKYFPIIIASIVVDFYASKGIEANRGNKLKCKLFLLISICFNLGSLFFFKYANFFILNINSMLNTSIEVINLTLPLGISFYSFQTLSYTIDVYRGNVTAEDNIIDFGAFVSLFPQLIAGPIVKYTDINKELKERVVNLTMIEEGIEEFIIGLSKKVLIANNIGLLWDEVQSIGFNNISTPLAWLGILAFSFQIYFDFSGYSSMAIGLGKILGFTFPQNFNFPYISRSITEFWRRWHMTLGSWFREYVYIPLGGNRGSKLRLYINLFIVWFLTGFWHGAEYNFILWGIFFFILISLEKLILSRFLKDHKILSHLYTIFFLLIGWSIFAITNFRDLGMFIKRLFVYSGGVDWIYYLRNYIGIILIACICSTMIIDKLYVKIKNRKWLQIVTLITMFIISVAYLVDATYNPFLYFRF